MKNISDSQNFLPAIFRCLDLQLTSNHGLGYICSMFFQILLSFVQLHRALTMFGEKKILNFQRLIENPYKKVKETVPVVPESGDVAKIEEQEEEAELFDNRIIEQFLESDKSIFDTQNFTLRTLFHPRVLPKMSSKQKQLDELAKQVQIYFQMQTLGLPNSMKNPPLDPDRKSQYFTGYSKIVPGALIFVEVHDVSKSKVNIIMRTLSGELFGYSCHGMKAKKYQVIKKKIQRLPRPLLIIVLDHCSNPQEEVNLLKPIFERWAENLHYLYIFTALKLHPIEAQAKLYLESDKFEYTERPNGAYFYSNSLRGAECSDRMNQLIEIAHNFEVEDSHLLKKIKRDPSLTVYPLDYMLVNISRAFQIEPYQAAMKILDLLAKEKVREGKKQIERLQKKQRLADKDKDSHHLQKSPDEGKFCKKCELDYDRKQRKTKLICEGCSGYFMMEIHLCPECHGLFHKDYNFYERRLVKKYKLDVPLRKDVIKNFIRNEGEEQKEQDPGKIKRIVGKINSKLQQNAKLTEILIGSCFETELPRKLLLSMLTKTVNRSDPQAIVNDIMPYVSGKSVSSQLAATFDNSRESQNMMEGMFPLGIPNLMGVKVEESVGVRSINQNIRQRRRR